MARPSRARHTSVVMGILRPSDTMSQVRRWEKALQSTDTAEVLATLTWLSGRHWNPKDPAPDFEHEDMAEARLADAVRARDGVKAWLKQLSALKNEWLRQAANLASSIEYY